MPIVCNIFLSILFATMCDTLAAQSDSATPRNDEANSFSSAVEKYIVEKIDQGKIVGCSALVFKDGNTIYHEVFGQSQLAKNVPIEQDTIWRIYSMSKPITSVAVMQLVESKKIALDDEASKYLPEFKNLKVYSKDGEPVACKREMTVRDLLRHTSGLTYGFFGNSATDKAYRNQGILVSDKTIGETVEKLGKIPLQYQPGTRWHYSVSTDVLGRLVEVVSGMPFDDYLKKNIFEPLKMNDTFFSVPKNKQTRLAEMYRFGRDGKLATAPARSSRRFLNETGFFSGGGGLCSTTNDYLQFAKMLLNEGELNGVRIIQKTSHAEMIKNQLPEGAANKGFQFGLGFRIDDQGHYSWGGAAGTRFWVDPKNKMITMFMIQINPYQGGHGKAFKRIVYKNLIDE
jgi:CubicO group peptidase (beta-lactamase class C family)